MGFFCGLLLLWVCLFVCLIFFMISHLLVQGVGKNFQKKFLEINFIFKVLFWCVLICLVLILMKEEVEELKGEGFYYYVLGNFMACF